MDMYSPNTPTTYQTDEEDIPLVQLTHAFMQGSAWLAEGMHKRIATYDLYIRDMPVNRSYLMFGGLEEVVGWLQKLHFSEQNIAFLLEAKLVSDEFANYLRNFKFTGTVMAMPEGTIFFPGEPMIRVTAPLIEASIIESWLMTTVVSNTLFLSKAARIKVASKGRFALCTCPFRAHSLESGIKACRAGEMCGMQSVGTPAIAKKYHLPIPNYVVTVQHLFITAFPTQIEAFRTIAKYNPNNCGLMLDTYGVERGIEDAIVVAKELEADGKKLRSVTIDSGDVIELTKFVRQRLDDAGLPYVKINLMGNMEERKVATLVEHNTPCDLVVCVTDYVTCPDSPKLEIVYKLAELRDGEDIHYAAKFAPGKLSYPGRKQIFRHYSNGLMDHDVIGLENESETHPLLETVLENHQIVKPLPSINHLKQYIDAELASLPEDLQQLDGTVTYPVEISPNLDYLLHYVHNKHANNWHMG